MSGPDDIDLLAAYARHNSEGAFTTPVERCVNLVCSVELRGVGHAHAADDITPAVFLVPARKARS